MAEEKALRRLRVSLALNVLIVLLAADGVMQHFSALGWGMFRYYTLCSNVFLLLACAVCAAYQAAILGGKRLFLPSWASLLKYFAVCTVAVTLFVVVFVLAPMMGGGGMLRHLLFSRSMFAHHFACPLLGIFSLLFADDTYLTDPKLARFALAPTLLYAAIVIALNLLRVLRGPYPFLYVYEQPVWMSIFWCVVILGLAYALAWGLRRLSLLTARREETADAAPEERLGWSADGYIIDQDCFSAYTYRTLPASDNACGCIAAFDLRRRSGQEVRFADVLAEMDGMHLLHIPGPTENGVMRAYLRKYLPGFREVRGREACLAAAERCAMGVLRYWEQRVPHFVAFYRTEDGRARFFNVSDGAEDLTVSVRSFFDGHCTLGPVRLFCWDA